MSHSIPLLDRHALDQFLQRSNAWYLARRPPQYRGLSSADYAPPPNWGEVLPEAAPEYAIAILTLIMSSPEGDQRNEDQQSNQFISREDKSRAAGYAISNGQPLTVKQVALDLAIQHGCVNGILWDALAEYFEKQSEAGSDGAFCTSLAKLCLKLSTASLELGIPDQEGQP